MIGGMLAESRATKYLADHSLRIITARCTQQQAWPQWVIETLEPGMCAGGNIKDEEEGNTSLYIWRLAMDSRKAPNCCPQRPSH
jgi:hypothetical protein